MRGMLSKTALAVAKAAAAIVWTQSGIVAQSIRLEGAAADSAVGGAAPDIRGSAVCLNLASLEVQDEPSTLCDSSIELPVYFYEIVTENRRLHRCFVGFFWRRCVSLRQLKN